MRFMHKMQNFVNPLMQFRTALLARMQKEGWTQSYLSKETGVSQSQISRILAGKTKRTSRAMRVICKYSEIDFVVSPIEKDQQKAIDLELRKLIRGSSTRAAAVIELLKAGSLLSQ